MKQSTKIRRAFPVSLVITALLLSVPFALAGCGGGNDSGDSDTTVNTAVSQISERFPISGDAAYRYQLASSVDASAPVEVSWRDQPLAENVDYQINRESRFILLKRALPPDATETGVYSLLVKYKSQQSASLTGN